MPFSALICRSLLGLVCIGLFPICCKNLDFFASQASGVRSYQEILWGTNGYLAVHFNFAEHMLGHLSFFLAYDEPVIGSAICPFDSAIHCGHFPEFGCRVFIVELVFTTFVSFEKFSAPFPSIFYSRSR